MESCLGILQSQFATIQICCKLWQMDTIYEIMIVCVIMHHMIIEDKRDNNLEPLFNPTNVGQLRCGLTSQTYMEGNKKLENSKIFYNLRKKLIKHLQAMKNLNQFDWNKIVYRLYHQSLIYLPKTCGLWLIIKWLWIMLNYDIYVSKIVCKIWNECLYMAMMGCVIVIKYIVISVNVLCASP